ncbi:hypothetical protein PSP6_80143 [Paraburkholderia tropica]|nr:hypothetical protein PSP6_80143 [Paraburkholderia tropica]
MTGGRSPGLARFYRAQTPPDEVAIKPARADQLTRRNPAAQFIQSPLHSPNNDRTPYDVARATRELHSPAADDPLSQLPASVNPSLAHADVRNYRNSMWATPRAIVFCAWLPVTFV